MSQVAMMQVIDERMLGLAGLLVGDATEGEDLHVPVSCSYTWSERVHFEERLLEQVRE